MAAAAASGTLLSPRADVWALVSEPHHLPDWWPGYRAVRPDRRGLAEGARWTVVRGLEPGLFRRPESDGLIIVRRVQPERVLAWYDVQQAFDAALELADDGAVTLARVTLDAPWWRLHAEGLRRAPEHALARLHDLCQTAVAL